MGKNARPDQGPGPETKGLLTTGKVLVFPQVYEDESLAVWLPGQPPRKSNHRRVHRNPRTGSPILRLSSEATAWVDGVVSTTPVEAKINAGTEKEPVEITFFVWYSTHSPDLSVELILDAMQKAGILSDDRYVFSYTPIKIVDEHLQGVLALICPVDEEELAKLAFEILMYRLNARLSEHGGGLT